jgi:hypothetical protein
VAQTLVRKLAACAYSLAFFHFMMDIAEDDGSHSEIKPERIVVEQIPRVDWPALKTCHNSFLSEHVLAHAFSSKAFSTLDLAVSAMIHLNKEHVGSCGGITRDGQGCYTLRRGCVANISHDGLDTSWLLQDAEKKLLDPSSAVTPNFVMFKGMFIPGYPMPSTPGFPRVYNNIAGALRFCDEHQDMCTGVTFNPSIGEYAYSVRSSNSVVASAAGEVSWMHHEAVKRSVYLQSEHKAAFTKMKKARYEWIDEPSFVCVAPKNTFDDPQQ